MSSGRRVRRRHPISEKLKIVKLSLQPGVSVAEVARAHGVNANQVFTWRRAFERGKLSEPCAALIPVTVSNPEDERRASEAAATTPMPSHLDGGNARINTAARSPDFMLVSRVINSLHIFDA